MSSSAHGVDKYARHVTRTTAKDTKVKNSRAKRAKLLFLILEYAN